MSIDYHFNLSTDSNLSILNDILPKVILHSTGVIFNNNLPLNSNYPSHSSLHYITSLLGSEGEKLDLFEVNSVIQISIKYNGPVQYMQ